MNTEDFYFILSNGLFAGTVADPGVSDNTRFVRILSHGLLDSFASPVVGGNLLRIIGSGFRKIIG